MLWGTLRRKVPEDPKFSASQGFPAAGVYGDSGFAPESMIACGLT